MSLLKKLTEITENKISQDKATIQKIKGKALAEKEQKFKDAIADLQPKLIKLAEAGERRYVVYYTSDTFNEFTGLSKLIKECGNYARAWNEKKITAEDVKKYMSDGVFKRVYDLCINMELNPKIDYWRDDQYEGFQIIVEW